MSSDAKTNQELNTMEEDEEAMRRANSEVMQMQQRMMEGEPSFPPSLPSSS